MAQIWGISVVSLWGGTGVPWAKPPIQPGYQKPSHMPTPEDQTWWCSGESSCTWLQFTGINHLTATWLSHLWTNLQGMLFLRFPVVHWNAAASNGEFIRTLTHSFKILDLSIGKMECWTLQAFGTKIWCHIIFSNNILTFFLYISWTVEDKKCNVCIK